MSVRGAPKTESHCDRANERGMEEEEHYSPLTLYLNSYAREHFVMSVYCA